MNFEAMEGEFAKNGLLRSKVEGGNTENPVLVFVKANCGASRVVGPAIRF